MRTQSPINSIRMTLERWIETARGRRELRNLSEHLLKDLGISRVDSDREAQRPFWDLDGQVDVTLQRNRRTIMKNAAKSCAV